MDEEAAATAAATSWPALPVAEWQATRDTLHLWTQILGKERLAPAPPVNHWWPVTLHLWSGLTTSVESSEACSSSSANAMAYSSASGAR